MTREDWTPTQQQRPEPGQRIVWLSPAGDEVPGFYEGIWFQDDGMYVYYTPPYWRPGEE